MRPSRLKRHLTTAHSALADKPKAFFVMKSHFLKKVKLDMSRTFQQRSSNVCRRLKGIHSRPDTNRTGAEGLSFYYPRLLHCLDQMLAVMSSSQHRVSSSKTVRPRAPCGGRCIGHTVSTWF